MTVWYAGSEYASTGAQASAGASWWSQYTDPAVEAWYTLTHPDALVREAGGQLGQLVDGFVEAERKKAAWVADKGAKLVGAGVEGAFDGMSKNPGVTLGVLVGALVLGFIAWKAL